MLSFIGATLGAVLAESFSSLRGGACEEPVAWFAAWLVGVVGGIFAAFALYFFGSPCTRMKD